MLSVGRFVVLLNDISTVNKVNTKPAIVKEMVAKSETTEYIYSSLGSVIIFFHQRKVIPTDKRMAKK